MKTTATFLCLLVTASLAVAKPSTAPQTPAAATTNYIATAMIPSGVGMYCVKVTLKGKQFNFMIDTGSSYTLVDPDVLKLLNIEVDRSRSTQVYEVTGRRKKRHVTKPVPLKIGTCSIAPTTLVIVDLESVLPSPKKTGGPRIHGIIGGNILKNYEAILDYGRLHLFLLDLTPSLKETAPAH